jgi:excisionase family DNA binding protein
MQNMTDYLERDYLSTTEVAAYLGIKVKEVLALVRIGKLPANKSAGGQYRISIEKVKLIEQNYKSVKKDYDIECFELEINNTTQKIFLGNSQNMDALDDNSVHLVITSPPYFDAKMYSNETIENDLGNVHNMND